MGPTSSCTMRLSFLTCASWFCANVVALQDHTSGVLTKQRVSPSPMQWVVSPLGAAQLVALSVHLMQDTGVMSSGLMGSH